MINRIKPTASRKNIRPRTPPLRRAAKALPPLRMPMPSASSSDLDRKNLGNRKGTTQVANHQQEGQEGAEAAHTVGQAHAEGGADAHHHQGEDDAQQQVQDAEPEVAQDLEAGDLVHSELMLQRGTTHEGGTLGTEDHPLVGDLQTAFRPHELQAGAQHTEIVLFLPALRCRWG